ncbi:MAG: OmpA family protein [Candidatus Methylomirabilales bacterium]
MGRGFIVVSVVAAGIVFATGCATKRFLREELQKTDTTVTKRVRTLETDLDRQKNQLRTLARQVTEVRALVDEANRRTHEATSKADRATRIADQALARVEQADSRLRRLSADRHKRELVKTVVVRFAFNRWELDAPGQAAIMDVVTELRENPNLGVELEGHTDSVGSALYNLELSQRRAQSVRRFLVIEGVDLHRIQSIGLGELQPVADNTTKDGRAQNRRVAIKLFIATE